MDELDDLVKEFLVESFEYLNTLDEDLLELENESADPELLARIFRAVHTIKGTGGFLNFEKLVGIAHAGEGLLDGLRKGMVPASEDVVSALFTLVDAIRTVLSSIEDTGKEGEAIFGELIETLVSLQHHSNKPAKPAAEAEKPAETAAPVEEQAEEPAEVEEDVEGLGEIIKEFVADSLEMIDTFEESLLLLEKGEKDIEAPINSMLEVTQTIKGSGGFLSLENLIEVAGAGGSLLSKLKEGAVESNEIIVNAFFKLEEVLRAALDDVGSTGGDTKQDFSGFVGVMEKLANGETVDPDALKSIQVASKGEEVEAQQKEVSAEPPQAASSAGPAQAAKDSEPKQQPKPKKKSGSKSKSSLADNNIRVDVELLDALMNLVGELVLTRNQIMQLTAGERNTALVASFQHLNLITTELQEGVMKTRMQTIGNIWRKFPRVVRDLSIACDKKARVTMEGAETELDKTIIEAINDPLTHLIRNAVDHGLELPADRLNVGKSEEGTIKLYAYHEGGRVNIEISDDGGGINPEKIKNKAIENGIVTQGEAAKMSDREVYNLIFMPGFSTAQQVSNISGRGVGMDVVKTYIERIGGTVDVHSKMGVGTTFKIKIPLTLAIVPALIVTTCGDRFALPQVNLLELVRLEGEQLKTGIEMIHNTPVHRLRGKLLPLVYLDKELQLKRPPRTEEDENEPEALNIVVLQAEDQTFGLVVDEVLDTEEVVVKPLSKQLKHIAMFAGATIMGDGKIALILDVLGFARQGGVMSEEVNARMMADSNISQVEQNLESVLLLRVGVDRHLAVPLSMVSRLEEISNDQVEWAGSQEVVRYRGYLMPLLRLSNVVGAASEEKDWYHVVVCKHNGLNVGLVVDEIVDVVDHKIGTNRENDTVMGVSVIQDRVTEVLNLQKVINMMDTECFESEEHYDATLGYA